MSKVLENLEAKFDCRPMPWMVAALKHKAELLYSGMRQLNFPIHEKRKNKEEREETASLVLEVVRKCQDVIGKKMLREKDDIFVNKLREQRPNIP